MKIKYTTIIKLCLVALSTIIFCNLNGLSTLFFGITAPFSPLMLLLSLIIIYTGWFKEKIKINKWWVITIIVFYIMYMYIAFGSYLWDSSQVHSGTSLTSLFRSYISSILIILAYYIGATVYLKERDLNFIIKYIFPFFLFTSVFVAIGPFIGLQSSFNYGNDFSGERSTGFFANPNEAGAFANLSLVVFLAALIVFKRKLWILPLIGIAIYGAITSFSKAAFLLSLFLIFIFLFKTVISFRSNGLKTNVFIFTFLTLIFFSVQYAIFNFEGIVSNLTGGQEKRVIATYELLQGKITKETTSDRDVLFKYGWRLIKRKPLIGNGLGSFHRFKGGKMQLGVHNTFLMIFGEAGIFILLLFIFYFIYMGFQGLIYPNAGLGFFIMGFVTVYLINICGTSHNALDDRTSNAILGMIIALLTKSK